MRRVSIYALSSKPRMTSVSPTCRGRGTIRILTADPEPPQIVPCTRCRGTGHHEPAVSRPVRGKALRRSGISNVDDTLRFLHLDENNSLNFFPPSVLVGLAGRDRGNHMH